MIRIRIKSLQQRLAIFLLLPVAILLFAMISLGFFFARENLLTEWRQVLILRLGRAAHTVDMRLSHPKEWLQMYLTPRGRLSRHRTGTHGGASERDGWGGACQCDLVG